MNFTGVKAKNLQTSEAIPPYHGLYTKQVVTFHPDPGIPMR